MFNLLNKKIDLKPIFIMIFQYLTPNSSSRIVLELSGIFIITFSLSLSYHYLNHSMVTDNLALASANIQVSRDVPKDFVANASQMDETASDKLALASKSVGYPTKKYVDDIGVENISSQLDRDDFNRSIAQNLNSNQNDVNDRASFVVTSYGSAKRITSSASLISRNAFIDTSSIMSSAEVVNTSSFDQLNSFAEDNDLIDSSLSDNLNVLSNSTAHGPIECPPIENFPISMQSGAIAIQRAKGCPI